MVLARGMRAGFINPAYTLSLNIYEDDQAHYASNYGHLSFDTPWNGHFVSVIMKNGDIVGYGDSGLWIGAFER
jgi:hypothetical protein